MSTHNICFHREIRKISAFFDEKSALSVAMHTGQKDQPPDIALCGMNSKVLR